jgi:hypothetical protein
VRGEAKGVVRERSNGSIGGRPPSHWAAAPTFAQKPLLFGVLIFIPQLATASPVSTSLLPFVGLFSVLPAFRFLLVLASFELGSLDLGEKEEE